MLLEQYHTSTKFIHILMTFKSIHHLPIHNITLFQLTCEKCCLKDKFLFGEDPNK